MFSFADTPVKVTGLLIFFVFCTVWEVVALRRALTGAQRVSSGLHLVMALVMLMMVLPATWGPLRDLVGFPVLVGFFVAGAGWFVALGLRSTPAGTSQRGHFVSHALMFAAMAWHLAGMAVKRSQMMADGGHTGGAGETMLASPAVQAVAWVGVPVMAYLLVSGVAALTRAVRPQGDARAPLHTSTAPGLVEVGCTAPHTVGGATHRWSMLAAAAMNLGMFWMSTGLLAPIAPWLGVLSI